MAVFDNRPIISKTQDICIEDIPDEFLDDKFLEQLPINGGNCLCVDRDTTFGQFLIACGFVFDSRWEYLVVYR